MSRHDASRLADIVDAIEAIKDHLEGSGCPPRAATLTQLFGWPLDNSG